MKLQIPENPRIVKVAEDVFSLSEAVVIDGAPCRFVRRSLGLSTILGDEEVYNVFVCDSAGEVLDWGGLCHLDKLCDGPSWLYNLDDAAETQDCE